jgi:hypothetical protein
MLLHFTPFRPHWTELKGRAAMQDSHAGGRTVLRLNVEMPRKRRTRFWAPATLACLVALSAALRFAAGRGVPSPWIAPDEMLYGLLGRDLYEHGRLTVLGGASGFYSLVYPALIGPALRLRDLRSGYEVVQAVQAVTMSLAGVPVYLWGRSTMRRGWALAAAALTLAIPALAYTGLLMTEVAFYPAFTLAAWATARTLLVPTVARQGVLVAAVSLAVLTRLQAVVLVPAVLTAIGLDVLFRRDVRRAARFWPLGALALALAAAGAVVGASSLGGYQSVVGAGYDVGNAAEFVLYHLGALLLLCGVAPACALATLAVPALRGRERSAEARAFVAVALAFTGWLVVEVGVFASRYADVLLERNLLGLAPLSFLALALWLDRGAPRNYLGAAATAFVAAAVVLLLPADRFVDVLGVQDSMTVAAALRVLGEHPGLDPLLLVGVPAAAAAALFALTPRRLAPLLVPALLLVFAAESVAASHEVRAASTERQALLVGPNPRWIDAAATAPVGYVFTGGAYFTRAWLNAFWNRSVRHVYHLPGALVLGPMPQTEVRVGDDGVLRTPAGPIPEHEIVLPPEFVPAGEQVATTELQGSDVATLGLWRLEGTPRLLEQRTGFNPNGDVPSQAELLEYACGRGGTFVVTLLGKTSQQVELLVNHRSVRMVALEDRQARTELVPAPGGPTCTLTLRPSRLVGTTVVRFARG